MGGNHHEKKHLILTLAATCLAFLLAACSGPKNPDGPVSGALPTDGLPEHWSASGEDIVFDGQDWESYYLSSLSLPDNDYRYSANVVFSDKDKGLAALVFQSSANHNDCYVASISALTNRAELYKVEQGLQIPMGIEIGLEDKDSYRLQVNMIDSHIAFFVDDTLICSTGDYMVASDLGQNDALMSGKLGLYGSDGQVTFQKPYPNEYGTMFSGCAVLDADNTSGLFGADGGIILYPYPANTGVSVFSEEGGSRFDVTITTASSMWN